MKKLKTDWPHLIGHLKEPKKLTDEQKLVRATKSARRRTTLGKIEELQKELAIERRRETAARARVQRITDRLAERAQEMAAAWFDLELNKPAAAEAGKE
ncbi:MAG: hypothetical protein KGJ86_22800 [Chloroflexota bacterium]|nr:hypothetical protein [Chloroflexota bacterium]